MSRPPTIERDALERAESAIFTRSSKVRFQDVDAAGTVFFPRVLEMFADTYLALLDDGGLDLPRRLREGGWVAPIVHAEVDFLAPMRFGDAFLAEIVATHVGSTSFAVGHRLRAAGGGKVLAVGHTAHVVVDATTFRPTPVPSDLRAALRA